jgi:hypothetical protein
MEVSASRPEPGSAPASAGRYLIIAVAEPGGHAPLPGLAEAAQRLAEVLRQAGERNIEVLREPRAEDAIRAIEQAVRDATDAGETLLVYVGGHGVIGTDGDLVLLTPDATPGRQGTGLRARDLHQVLNAPHLPAPRVLMLDTSSAGTAVVRHSWGRGTAVLCSASAGEDAIAPGGSRRDFTGWVVQGIATGEADIDGDGFIDVAELSRYVADGFAREATDQRPVLLLTGDPAEFVISRNPRPPRRRRNLEEVRPEVMPPLIEPFVNRSAELQALRSVLGGPPRQEGDGPLIVGLTGPAGMGKTQLAVRVAGSLRERYPHGVLYSSARSGYLAAVAAFASALGFRAGRSGQDPASFLRESTADLAVLFVLDDVDSDIKVDVNLPVSHHCAVLVAARTPNVVPAGAPTVSLPPLDAEAARILAEQIVRQSGATVGVDTVLSRAGGNPLYVRLIGSAAEPGAGGGETPVPLQDVIASGYASLPAPAAALFRRAVLVGKEGLDDEIAELLVDGAGERKAIDALVASGLVAILPDGRAEFVSDSIREFAAQQLMADEDRADTEALRERVRLWILVNRQYQPEPRIARDYWTTDDKLGYAPYADAVAAFIRHRATLPPLTIGIKAPWGAGKTSLMRMVQNRLDPPADKSGYAISIRLTASSRSLLRHRRWRRLGPGEPDSVHWRGTDNTGDTAAESGAEQARIYVTNREVLKRAKKARSGGSDSPVLRAEPEAPPGLGGGWRATVWFNPWIYQSSEQIWAGFAHEIIRQITSRLPIGDRERFWLELNLARLDTDAIRRRAYRAIWGRALPFLGVVAAAIVVSLFAFSIGRFTEATWLKAFGSGVAGTGAVALIGGLVSAMRFFTGAATGPFAALVRGPDLIGSIHGWAGREFTQSFDAVITDPGYATKLGFLHLVQEDMKRVLQLVATERRPLVIFVDDLDRCSPGTVAQVIEAINLFLAGEFPNCIFVLAMEPALVAAHIEATYKDLVAALKQGRAPGEWSTLGWRFLEKIVQLPLSLPVPQDTHGLDGYLSSLLTTDGIANSGRLAASDTSTTAAPEPRGPVAEAPAAVVREVGRYGGAETAGASGVVDTDSASLADGIDLALVEKLTDGIRARRPTLTTLPTVARLVQAEIVPGAGQDRLLQATIQASDRVFADLYSDADALNAIGAALPALSSANPREIKRYINLFRFYTFIVQRQRLHGVVAPAGGSIAKLAALAIRWPHLLSLLTQQPVGATSPMNVLERGARAASNSEDDPWREALTRTGLYAEIGAGDKPLPLPDWSRDLRDFLATGPEVGEAAARLL